MLQYGALAQRASQFLAMTNLTVREFRQLLDPFKASYAAPMETRTIEGSMLWKRRYSSYRNSPLPSPEQRLLFLLVYLKQGLMQDVRGMLCGMNQANANKWIHLLLPPLALAARDAKRLPEGTMASCGCAGRSPLSSAAAPSVPLLSQRRTIPSAPATAAKRSGTPRRTCCLPMSSRRSCG
jgi:hypothetical protein